jgi:hypothetical protein
MEADGHDCVQRHHCPVPEMPPPDERWFRAQAQKPRKPEQGVTAKVAPTVAVPERQERPQIPPKKGKRWTAVDGG